MKKLLLKTRTLKLAGIKQESIEKQSWKGEKEENSPRKRKNIEICCLKT